MQTCQCCGEQIRSGQPTFMVAGAFLCRECHDERQPLCPYCGKDLPKRPKAKTRCRHCGAYMFVRRSQSRYPSSMVTAAQVAELDAIQAIAEIGKDAADFDAMRHVLRQRFGQEPDLGDVVWGVMNSAVATETDLARVADIQEQMAYWLISQGRTDQGRDIRFRARQIRHRLYLEALKADGIVKSVEISPCPDHCHACAQIAGRKFSLDDAIRLSPLPCPACVMDIASDDGIEEDDEDDAAGSIDIDAYQAARGKGDCRCVYLPMID